MKVLFVATRKNSDPKDRELYEMDFMNGLLGFRRSLLDLGLMTVAACTPKDIRIEIVDEYLEPIPYDTDADLIALSAKTSCVTHAYEVADKFRSLGKKVVLGGIHASLRPQEALEHVDYVVIGEAEKTWPQFLKLFEQGSAPSIMPDGGFPEMDQIPVPAWEQVQYRDFLFHQVQTTRGCPFKCRFCSVPDISGSTFRFKPVEKVIEEIRAFPSSGLLRNKMKSLYIVDDNFISKLSYTKDLLKALAPLYAKGEIPEWSAETTFNVARDEELLDMFAAAGCTTLIIGFESISEATLKDMKKPVNFCISYQEGIERIHNRSMSVVGNFIVGFDTDTLDVFKDTLDFIQENLILYPFFSILTPMPGTKLHEEFKADGRLDHFRWEQYDTRHVVFEPKHMTREQLMDGYYWLYEQSYASSLALDRLNSYWCKFNTKGSGFLDHQFIKWKMRKFKNSGSVRFRDFVREGWNILTSKEVPGDVGQLLYYFDSAHFVDYLEQFKSAGYADHRRIFSGEVSVELKSNELRKKQWDRYQTVEA